MCRWYKDRCRPGHHISQNTITKNQQPSAKRQVPSVKRQQSTILFIPLTNRRCRPFEFQYVLEASHTFDSDPYSKLFSLFCLCQQPKQPKQPHQQQQQQPGRRNSDAVRISACPGRIRQCEAIRICRECIEPAGKPGHFTPAFGKYVYRIGTQRRRPSCASSSRDPPPRPTPFHARLDIYLDEK